MLQIGDRIDHYTIRKHIMQSGMSDVYLADDLLTGKNVAIKIPDATILGDPTQYERFKREIEIMNRLEHPAVQRGIEAGRYNRVPYLATEWIEGQSMRELVSAEAPLSPHRAAALIGQIAEGIAYCHDHGVVHRDLKPENVIITPEGQPVLLDFGLALLRDARRVTYASLTTAAGTPEYMAPEQVEGQRGDKRTDIYALGGMLFELLTGEPPVSGDSNLAIMAQLLRGEIPRADAVNPEVPEHLTAIAARCLRRQPEARYEDVRDLILDLQHPERVDLTVLDEAEKKARGIPIWQSQTLVALGISVLLLAVIVLIAVGAQALKGALP